MDKEIKYELRKTKTKCAQCGKDKTKWYICIDNTVKIIDYCCTYCKIKWKNNKTKKEYEII